MVFIELTRLQPLDIVLTSGTGVFSYLIRGAVALRGRRLTHYSHAAFVLSPNVLVEALTAPGIIWTDLSEEPLHFRYDKGKLAVFAQLPKAANAQILRHHALLHDMSSEAVCLRSGALEALVEVYLKQYSSLVRLAEPVIQLPPHIKNFIGRFTGMIDGRKPEPGPFCSELVSLLLEAAGIEIAGTMPGTAQATAPDDFAWLPEVFVDVPAVWECEVDRLPGVPCSDSLARLFDSTLTNARTEHRHAGNLLEVLNLMPSIMAGLQECDQTGTRKVHEEYAKQRHLARKRYIDNFNLTMYWLLDPLWEWAAQANACMEDCPNRRNDQFTPAYIASALGHAGSWRQQVRKSCVDPDNKVNPPFRPTLKTSDEVFWEEMAKWNGQPCTNMENCVVARLSTLQRRIEVGLEGIRAEIHEAAQASREGANKNGPA